jgi:hypothetical protein
VTAISLRKAADMLSLWPSAVNVLAAVSAVAAVAAGGTTSALGLALVVLAAVIWRQRKTLRRVPRGIGGAGRYLTSRFLLVATSAALLSTEGALTPLTVAVLLLAILTIAAEPLLHTLNGIAVPYAVNVPGRSTRNLAAFPYGWLFPLNLLIVLLLVLASLAPTVLVPVAAGLIVVSLATVAAALLDVVRRIRARRAFQQDLPQILEEMEPVFYIYWHAPARSSFQVMMWLPYLERLGVPFAIVVRTVGNFRQLHRRTEHPVILRRSMSDLDALSVPSARGVFYVNNAMRNTHMIRYSALTHIQLLHGESDKAASANPITRMYDRDFVAGQAAIDRFDTFGVPMPRDIFRIVGRPQVENVQQARGQIGDLEDRAVLYAPTWLGYQAETNYSSLPVGADIVRALLERGCRVVFRPHPYARRAPELRQACQEITEMLAADAARTGREHLFGAVAEQEMDVVDCFNAVDAMISDVSGVVGDFLHSGKPLAMVSPDATAEEFVEMNPMARAAYVLVAADGVLQNLDSVMEALTRDDPQRAERERWAIYYLGDIPRDGYAQRFVDVARAELGIVGD